MKISHRDWRRNVVWTGLACVLCLAAAGCGESVVNSSVAHPGAGDQSASPNGNDAAMSSGGAKATSTAADAQRTAATDAAAADPSKPRTFAIEGPDGAARITFDDLDLLKLLNMDPVTADCIEKMPDWLKGLSGRKVRVRGYMKPGTQLSEIPQFLLVRSTDLCCFGPKGKVYHMIAVSLKPGTTTDYIELKPFDVVGSFRIEMIQLDDGTIFLLYHINDGVIIRS
jgi:hypothetical protein